MKKLLLAALIFSLLLHNFAIAQEVRSAELPPEDILSPPAEPPMPARNIARPPAPPIPPKSPEIAQPQLTNSFPNNPGQGEIERLRRDLNDMQSFIYRTPEGQVQQQKTTSSMQGVDANLVAGVGRFDEELRQLRGKIEEQQFKIQKLEERLNKISEDNEFRFRKLEGGEQVSGSEELQDEHPEKTQIRAENPAAPASMAKTGSGAGESKSLGTVKVPVGEEVNITPAHPAIDEKPEKPAAKQQFDAAFELLKSGRKQEAISAFEDFIAKNPKDKRAGNAHFWVGEAYFAQKEYADAARKYVDSYKKFPKGDKAPEALFKLSSSLEKLEKKKEACVSLAELYEKFPKMPSNVKKRADEQKKKLSCKI